MSEQNEPAEIEFETIRSYTCDHVERVLKETWSENRDACHDWNEMHNNWIDVYKSLTESEDPDYMDSQITFHRFNELFRNLRWHMTAVFSGAYDSAVRELRFILEDICQAFYLDDSFAHLDVDDRYKKIQGEDRRRGRTLIRLLKLPEEIQKEFLSLYGKLCEYVHPSFSLLQESKIDPKVVFFYKKEWFLDTKTLHRQTCDAVFYLMLRTFPETGPIFFSRPYVVSSLREMDCLLTLSLQQESHQ